MGGKLIHSNMDDILLGTGFEDRIDRAIAVKWAQADKGEFPRPAPLNSPEKYSPPFVNREFPSGHRRLNGSLNKRLQGLLSGSQTAPGYSTPAGIAVSMAY